MAGDNDDKDNEPNPEPPTEGVGTGAEAGDTPGKGSGEVPPSPEGQGKVQGKKTGTSADDDDFFDTHSSDSEDSDKKKKKPKRPDAFDLLPGLKDVPEGRAQRSFLRAGSRQSMGVGRTEDDSVDNDEEVEGGRATKPEVINLDVESGKPVINGRALKVSLTKKDAQVSSFTSTSRSGIRASTSHDVTSH